MNFGQIFLAQSPSALFGIRSIVGLIPGLDILVGVVILFFFPLRGERLIELKQMIMNMHADKEGRLSQSQPAVKRKGRW
ncbi:MAG: hypothetical protein K0B06_08680 [Brevefilum sp.]|nr:hypothetical protein [Brevefilum sp.]